MKKILICALAFLCVASFAKTEDGWEKIDEEKEILLDWSEKPYMRLIDEYTGKPMNVWTSTATGETIYYVDYPWVVRVPEELEVDDDLLLPIPNAPKVEGGYYFYDGAYLASSPNSALDQVKNELAARNIKSPKVALIRPEKVILTSTLFPGIQFIGLSKGDAEKSKDDYGFDKNPILELTIAVPAKDKETFETAYKRRYGKGWFDLEKEQELMFKDPDQENGLKARTFTSKVNLLPDHGMVTNIVLNLKAKQYERTRYQFPKQTFICHSDAGIAQEHQFTFVLPDKFKDFQIEAIDSDGKETWGEQRLPNTIRTNVISDTGKTLQYIVNAYTYPTTSSKRWYRHTRYYRHSSAISLSPLVALVNRNGNNMEFLKNVQEKASADGVTVIDFILKPKNEKKAEGVDEQLLQSVTVTYSDGWQEVYSADKLPVGVPKIFGTLKLEYTQTKDDESGKVVGGQVTLTDLLTGMTWYKKNPKANEKALIESAIEKLEKRNR